MWVMQMDKNMWAVLNVVSSSGYPRVHIVEFTPGEGFVCDCEHFKFRGRDKQGFACRHIRAVIKTCGTLVKGEGDPESIDYYIKNGKKGGRKE